MPKWNVTIPDETDRRVRGFLARNLAAIERGIEDVRADRGQPMKETLREIADELRLELDR